jgi:hypothetical protein
MVEDLCRRRSQAALFGERVGAQHRERGTDRDAEWTETIPDACRTSTKPNGGSITVIACVGAGGRCRP